MEAQSFLSSLSAVHLCDIWGTACEDPFSSTVNHQYWFIVRLSLCIGRPLTVEATYLGCQKTHGGPQIILLHPNFTVALQPLISGQRSNIMQKAWQTVGLAGEWMSAALLPRLIAPQPRCLCHSLHPRGEQKQPVSGKGLFEVLPLWEENWLRCLSPFPAAAWVVCKSLLDYSKVKLVK